ncbi:hypothetical protein C0J52_13906 [Blattella germanica]|nr:hypothetical protein C0J52_13906 [Blattella germanica]
MFIILQTIKEGIVVLGCVRSIEEYKLIVSLPGKLVGEVAITSISQPYIDALENVVEGKNEVEKVLPLNEMFQLGQRIVTRVVDVGEKIKLSLMPEEVQADWSLRSLTVGCFIMAAVRSHEENGYVMDTGIKNVRAFLKNSAAQKYENVWNNGKSLGIGQVLKCVVRKANVTSVAATLELSADPEKLCNALDDTKLSLDMLLPGTVFNTTISKVIHSDGRGVVLKLQHQFKGFAPIHHCSKNVAEEKEKIEVGSKRKCRVLAFDYMAETFICTLRKYVTFNSYRASVLHPADLKPGMKVVCQIKEHLGKGTLVVIDASARSIMAFVRKEHMGNIPVKNPEKKFPVGSQHTAKICCSLSQPLIYFYTYLQQVLHADGNNVQLTLKPKLVESDAKVLHRFNQFKKGMSCEGVVMLIKKKGLLVTFFGIVKGWLPLEDGNTADKFYVGQLVSEYGTGKIPAQHLTNNSQMASLLLNTYSPEDVIENAYCLQSQHPPTFTLQPAFQKYFQNPLVKLKPGDRVKGKVIATEDTGVVISLNCGAQGVVTPFLSRRTWNVRTLYSSGALEILTRELDRTGLDIVALQEVRWPGEGNGKLTNGLQIGADVRGEILTVRPELVVVVLKGRGRQQLAYIPVRRHLNDFTPDVKKFKPGKTSKLIIVA